MMNNENIATKMGLLFLFYFSYLSFGFLVLDSVSDYFFPSDDSTCCKCNVETCDNPNLDRTIDRADVTTMRSIDPVSHAVSRAFFMALLMTPAMYYYRRKKEKEKEQNQFKQ